MGDSESGKKHRASADIGSEHYGVGAQPPPSEEKVQKGSSERVPDYYWDGVPCEDSARSS